MLHSALLRSQPLENRFKLRGWYVSANLEDVVLVKFAHPRALGNARLYEICPGRAFGMPRQRHLVVGKRVTECSGDGYGEQTRCKSDIGVSADDDERSDLSIRAGRIQHSSADDTTLLNAWHNTTQKSCSSTSSNHCVGGGLRFAISRS